jgi:peptidoglycan/LPS O-acetylase OafA/YrhL
MRSSTGVYYDKLDHVRALAALLVFSWHFLHTSGIPYEYAPLDPLTTLFEEGHTGVALFMTLSGYLFAKLTYGIRISYPRFIWNRIVRLVPLLLLVLIIRAAIRVHEGHELYSITRYLAGLVQPIFPNGGWSITVELHFYLMLPFLLYVVAKCPRCGLWLICAAVLFRIFLYSQFGSVQYLAFWTIIGRFDQFMIGILAYTLSRKLVIPPLYVAVGVLAFLVFYQAFNAFGGFYGLGGYPSPSPVWIIMPTVEGLFYALLIVSYEQSAWRPPGLVGRGLAIAGQASYSIYLLQAFVIGWAAQQVGQILPTQHFAFALLGSLLASRVSPDRMAQLSLSESPFLALRLNYRKSPRGT